MYFIITVSAMNKFGHSLSSSRKSVQIIRSQPALPVTRDGDYNIEDHRLCNLGMPQEEKDACTKQYVDSKAENLNGLMLTISSTISTVDEKYTKILQNFEIIKSAQVEGSQKLEKNIISLNELITTVDEKQRERIQLLEVRQAALNDDMKTAREAIVNKMESIQAELMQKLEKNNALS